MYYSIYFTLHVQSIWNKSMLKIMILIIVLFSLVILCKNYVKLKHSIQ